MQTRIYVVMYQGPQGEVRRLVEATSAAQAIRHVVKDSHSAKVASTKDVASAMNDGVKIEKAGGEA